MSVTAFVALGSNLGNRQSILDQALDLLRQRQGIQVVRISKYLETEPVGGPEDQGLYLNAVAQIETELDPPKLLQTLLEIETQLGRVREIYHGPRTLDLDLLLFGQEVLEIHEPSCDLIIPHPRMHQRLFVLEPLVEIAPKVVHPIFCSTARDLLRFLRGEIATRVLTGLRAVVTGSTSGIGLAIAEAFAQAGAEVVIHGRRSLALAEEAASACRSQGVPAKFLLADLREDSGCTDLIEKGWKDGPIDIWVNNAGSDILTGASHSWSYEQKLHELWQVDVRATMLLSRAIGAKMKTHGQGVIINLGWDQAAAGMEGDSGELFTATKGAVMAFSRSLALSLAPQVRVHCIAPGWIRTTWGENAPAAWQERVLRETPLQRWGTPSDVAKLACWLASPAAAYITGQVWNVNGGAVRG